MSNRAENQRLGRIFTALQHVMDAPTTEEFADALWLAAQMRLCAALDVESAAVADATTEKEDTTRGRWETQSEQLAQSESTSPTSVPESRWGSLHSQSVTAPISSSTSLLPTLPDAVGLLRATRPLRKRIASRRRYVVDEVESAMRYAERKIRVPALRPALARQFDLALVVDIGTSMRMWWRTIQDFRRLLERSGAFRRMTMVRMLSDASEGLPLRAGMRSSATGRVVSKAELRDPTGRRLILMVSDCLGAGWYDGRVADLIEYLSNVNQISIAQVLPQWLWSRSALALGSSGVIRATAPALRNAKLKWQSNDMWLYEQVPEGIVVPLVALEARSLQTWACMAIGQSVASASGTILSTVVPSIPDGDEAIEQPEVESLPEYRIKEFREVASPEAQTLAGLLAAVPISVSIARHIAQRMQPPAGQAQIAELLMSGLLIEVDSGADSQEVLYDFVPGVREQLCNTVTVQDSVRLLQQVADFIDSPQSPSLNVRALLAEPRTFDVTQIPKSQQPLAQAAALVVRRLGGDHKQLAVRLQQHTEQLTQVSHGDTSDSAQVVEATVVQPEVHRSSVPQVDPGENSVDDAPRDVISEPEPHSSVVEPVDIELILRRYDFDRYAVEDHITVPGSNAEIRTPPAIVKFDFTRLRSLALDVEAYGRALGAMLFADPHLVQAFAQARAVAESQQRLLRLRMTIPHDANELHRLRWEAIGDPQGQHSPALTTSDRLIFSRYLASADWRPFKLRPKGKLRALMAIANPVNLRDYNITPVHVEYEAELLQRSLRGIETTFLSGTYVTRDLLSHYLNDEVDIVVLVLPALVVDRETWLFLEDEDGRVNRVAGRELANWIAELAQPPQLMLLMTGQRVGRDTGDALLALGPLLASSGVAAVLTMQGPLSINTAERLLPAFFESLQRTGCVDHALAVARAQVREQPDFWMPVLFMRLKEGRIWYVPGFTEEDRENERRFVSETWRALVESVFDGVSTPILGPDLTETFLGSRRDMARDLADDFNFPLAPGSRDNLPAVAQYLAVSKSRMFVPRIIVQYLCKALRRRFGDILPLEPQNDSLEKLSFRELIKRLDTWLLEVWNNRQTRTQYDPIRVLANRPFRFYVTADPSNLLIHALRAAGKDPQILFAPWNDYTYSVWSSTLDDNYSPSLERPLVYRLFGSYDQPDSLVLTEDDYLDYLIGITENRDRIPAQVRSFLADSSLLILGFHTEDRGFQTFFRSLMSQAGSARRTRYAHFMQMVKPEEGRLLLPGPAQRYLEDYFGQDASIRIYWGSLEDFVRELSWQMNEGSR